MTVSEAITEEQMSIINRSVRGDYSLEDSINDIDLIADLTEIKITNRMKNQNTNC